jgi:hypothetical protein
MALMSCCCLPILHSARDGKMMQYRQGGTAPVLDLLTLDRLSTASVRNYQTKDIIGSRAKKCVIMDF